MDILIRRAKDPDLKDYTSLLQRTYEKFYVNEELGIAKEHFSKEIFDHQDTQDYLMSNLQNNENQQAWIAFIGSGMVGSITVKKEHEVYEVNGFYVAPEHQGQGIGKKLWQKALDFTDGSDILIDLYAHNTKSIEMYSKWGFKVDKTRGDKGYFYRHWDEWPKDLKAKCVYMRLKNYKRA